MRTIAIVSPGTGVGKTLVTTSIAYQLSRDNTPVRVIKPIISGWEEENNDTIEILKSLGLPITEDNVNKISPWRFSAPVAPDIAARRENKVIALKDIINFCDNKQYNEGIEYLVIEIAGGILSPINNKHTMLDMVKSVNTEIFLVTGNYLGCISHTLMTYELIKSYKLRIKKVIISQTESNMILEETLTTLKNFIKEPITCINFIDVAQNKWQYTPRLSII